MKINRFHNIIFVRFKNIILSFGIQRCFSLGLRLDRYNFDLDLVIFFIGLEW